VSALGGEERATPNVLDKDEAEKKKQKRRRRLLRRFLRKNEFFYAPKRGERGDGYTTAEEDRGGKEGERLGGFGVYEKKRKERGRPSKRGGKTPWSERKGGGTSRARKGRKGRKKKKKNHFLRKKKVTWMEAKGANSFSLDRGKVFDEKLKRGRGRRSGDPRLSAGGKKKEEGARTNSDACQGKVKKKRPLTEKKKKRRIPTEKKEGSASKKKKNREGAPPLSPQ